MTFPDFTKLSVHVTCGCGSVLLCQHYDKLCTSSCLDRVMFAQCTMARSMRQKAYCVFKLTYHGQQPTGEQFYVYDCLLLNQNLWDKRHRFL